MHYIITNDRQYVQWTTRGVQLTNHLENATKFTKEKAANVNANLPKIWRKFHLKLKLLPPMKESTEIIKYTDITFLTDRTKEFLTNAQDISIKMKNELDRLSGELSDVDKAKVDIEHKIELSEKVNACMGYKYFATLKDILKKRRMIKDDIQYISYILGSTIKDCGEGKPLNFINGMENRQYTARIMSSLFENGKENNGS
ncbi:MAG: hypothetical protein KH031_09840 [Clostridiales bacterium]|nr:hypothetical protein [Clostridiales bacterium]